MVLKDTPQGDVGEANAAAAHPPTRGLKHHLEDDQMSVGSKRPDITSSADKKKNKPKGQKFKSK